MVSSTMASSAKPRAAPNGQLRDAPNCICIRLADHQRLAAAEQHRRDIRAEAGDEHQQAAGDDARRAERHNDAGQRAAAVGAEIIGRLDQPPIEFSRLA